MHKHCLQFLLGVKEAPRETENNAYAKFWGDKQRVLWYAMVFSGVVNSERLCLEYIKVLIVILSKYNNTTVLFIMFSNKSSSNNLQHLPITKGKPQLYY